MIETINIHKSFGNLHVLKGINLKIEKGEVVSITGSSGTGKTTLLQIMGTLDKANEGEVIIDGKHVADFNEKQLASFRNRQIGFVFQFHHLLPEFTALENVCIPAYIAGQSKQAAEQKAIKLLKILKVENRKMHKPAEMSGGEQQRIAIARALINEPAVVLADEPSGNLDALNSEDLHKLFFNLRDELDQTFVIVTHDPILAEQADRKIVLKNGQVLV